MRPSKHDEGNHEPAWYFLEAGETQGPYHVQYLKDLVRSHRIRPDTHVAQAGEEWRPAGAVPDLRPAFREVQHAKREARRKNTSRWERWARRIILGVGVAGLLGLCVFAGVNEDRPSRSTAEYEPLVTESTDPMESEPERSVPHIVDLRAIAGVDQDSVARVLGEPFKVENIPEGAIAAYYRPASSPRELSSGGSIEVDFVNGRADWITIKGQTGMPYSPAVLQSLGLSTTPPSFSNQHFIAWTTIPGFKEIRVFPDHQRGRVHYVWVNVFTSP